MLSWYRRRKAQRQGRPTQPAAVDDDDLVHIRLGYCSNCGSLAAGSYVIHMPRGFGGLCHVRTGDTCDRDEVTMGRAVVVTGMDEDAILREIYSSVDRDSPMRAEAAERLRIAPEPQFADSTFDEVETGSVEEAVRTVVDRGAAFVPIIDEARLMAEYAGIRTAWASNGLWSGAAEDLAEVLRVNLERDRSRLSNFEIFSIDVIPDQFCLQVSTYFDGMFLGYRIWRTTDQIHFCGGAQTILAT